MIRNGEASLDAAAARLQQAVELLEARVAALAARSAAFDPAAEDALHIELRETRLRERALESAATEASSVLGRAADRIRAALDEEAAAVSAALEAEVAAGEEPPASLDHLSDDQTDMHPHPREF
jgi:hypothetical protein